MSKALQKMLGAGGVIAAIGVVAAAAVLIANLTLTRISAQTLRGAGYIDPYAAYAYSPGLRFERTWEFSGNFDSKTGSLRYRELRVKPGAPVDSCFMSRLVPDRC
jgi:hypothetical protein